MSDETFTFYRSLDDGPFYHGVQSKRLFTMKPDAEPLPLFQCYVGPRLCTVYRAVDLAMHTRRLAD